MRYDLKEMALLTALDFAAVTALLRSMKAAMPADLAHDFERLAEAIRADGLFGAEVLREAEALVETLALEIEAAGGAPLPARTDEGDLYYVGGTDESRAYAELARCLHQYLSRAHFVSHAVEAEAALARRRAQASGA